MLGGKMNDLLIKVLSTVMVINAGMHFYYAYKKNVYESLKFLILTVLMAVSVGTTLTKQEIDNVWEKMTIIEQKIEMQEEEKKPEELNKRSGKKMGYRDCPCLKCDHGGEREKRIECRRKCTEFVAWKLSMQAVRQKKKEDKNKFYSETKLKCYRRKAMKQKTGRKR